MALGHLCEACTVLNVHWFGDCAAGYSVSVSCRIQSAQELDNSVSLAGADSMPVSLRADTAEVTRCLGALGVFVCFYWKLKCS